MPTATEYREAAARFRLISERLGREAAAQADWQRATYLSSGPARRPLDDSLDVVRLDLVAAGTELDRLAALCEHRAVVCAEYHRQVDRFWQLDSWVRALVPLPRPPMWWIRP